MRAQPLLSGAAVVSALVLGAAGVPRHGAPAPLNDANILGMLNVVNAGEIESGKLAQQKASSEAVKGYGKKIEDDHQKAQEKVNALAKRLKLTPSVPPDDKMKQEHQETMQSLNQKSGTEFDREFLSAEAKDHEKVIDKINKDWLPAAKDQSVKSLLQTMLPELQDHLSQAKALERGNLAAGKNRDSSEGRDRGAAVDSTGSSAPAGVTGSSSDPANSGAGGARPPDTVGKRMPGEPVQPQSR